MTSLNKLPKNPKNKQLARNLRSNATKEENHLWYDFLRTYDIKFHRQISIGDYIVDFFCPKAKLVIELDGSQHYTPQQKIKDAERIEYLNSLDIAVLRFTNPEIHQYFEAVCQRIHETVCERTKSLLPGGEGGAPHNTAKSD